LGCRVGWPLGGSHRILNALEPYDPVCVEDPIRADNPNALAALAESTRLPIAVGETLAGRTAFMALFASKAIDLAIVDISWVGGLTEAKVIAALADTYRLPFAAHDCTGPVVLTASTHLSMHVQNAYLQESVRAYYTGWYQDLLTELPTIKDGHIAPQPGPGLGTALQPDLRSRKGVHRRVSSLDRAH
jgi:galactonate dehydratase